MKQIHNEQIVITCKKKKSQKQNNDKIQIRIYQFLFVWSVPLKLICRVRKLYT